MTYVPNRKDLAAVDSSLVSGDPGSYQPSRADMTVFMNSRQKKSEAENPSWWDDIKNIPAHFVSTLGHVAQLPSQAAMEFMNHPVQALEAIPKGLLAGFVQLGRPVVNLPHKLYHGIPEGAPMTSAQIDNAFGIQGDPAGELAEFLGAGGPLALGEKAVVKGFGKLLPLVVEKGGRLVRKLIPGIRDTAVRAGYWGGFNKAEGGSGIEGLGTSFLADLPFLGKAALGRIPLNMAEKDARYTTVAGARNPEVRTPEEANQLLKTVGPQFPTSLGTLSGSRRLQKLESGLSWLPFSHYNAHMESGLYDTDQAAQQLIDHLRGDSSLPELGNDIHAGLEQAREAADQEMQKSYAPIESALQGINFKLTELPNFRKTVQQYLTGEADKIQKGIRSPLPDFTAPQQALLKSYLHKPTPQLNPLTFQYETTHPSFTEARQLESDLKAKARDEGGKGNTDTQKAFNAMAAALHDDYAHNAHMQGLTNVVPALKKAHQFAKSHYYEVWEKPAIHHLLSGKTHTVYTTLMKREHQALLSQLPQDLKHKLFLSHIASRIQEGQSGDRISPVTLSTLYAKQGLKDADAKSQLLDSITRQKFKRLLAMNELTKAARAKKGVARSGKMMMPAIKYGTAGAAGLGLLSHPWLWGPLAGLTLGGRKMGQYLTSPKTLARYSGLSKDVKKMATEKRFAIPFKGLGIAESLLLPNEQKK